MNNNIDKSFSNSNDGYFNNGQYLSNNGNYLNDNNSRNRINWQNHTLINSCRNLSITYITLWTILVLFYICIGPFLNTSYWYHSYYNYYYYYYYDSGWFGCFIAAVTVGPIIYFVLWLMGIFLMEKTTCLKRVYSNYTHSGLYVLFWLGLYFFGIFSFIASILTITNCNSIQKYNFESGNNSEYSNNVNKLDLRSVNASKWCSIFYIVISLILLILIITCSIIVSQSNYYSYYYYSYLGAFWGLIVGGPILGITLFILSIVLAAQTISLYKPFILYVKYLFIWFVLGLIWIPSFIGSIITVVRCDRIRNEYFDGLYLRNKIARKKLSIVFTALGSVVTIVGAGLVGGTYGSYNNYQLLASMYDNVHNDSDLLSLGYNLSYDNKNYFDNLLDPYPHYYSPYSFGEYDDNTIYGLSDFFDAYGNINEWLTNNSYGIINYLENLQSSSSKDSDLIGQTIGNFNTLQSQISNGFPYSDAIEDALNDVANNDNYKNDSIAQNLANAITAYNSSSGLLTTISTIDSNLLQLIDDKVIDLSSTSTMNSTTKQYFNNYISLLGTKSANASGASSSSSFVAMFDTNQAKSAFNNDDAIGLNDLSDYIFEATSQTFFNSIFGLYNFVSNSLDSSSSLDPTYRGFSIDLISPDEWNKNYANLTEVDKINMNLTLQTQKSDFLNKYPSSSDWDNAVDNWINNNPNFSSNYWYYDSDFYDVYQLQNTIYDLNCNYNADQNGVIAGSVLLSVGLLTAIISMVSLIVIVKRWNW